jgi:hypothetical protein
MSSYKTVDRRSGGNGTLDEQTAEGSKVAQR